MSFIALWNARPLVRRLLFPATLALVALPALMGHGYQVDEQSARRLGDAFSGGAAEARDATTAFYNPAGLVRLKQREYVAGFSLINNQTDFEGSGFTTDGLNLIPISGGDGGDPDSNIAIPHLYLALPVNDTSVFGLSINAPYATGTDYERSWVGRYFATESELYGVNLTGSIGVVVGDHLSLGLGLSLQMAEGKIENAVNAAGICALVAAQGGLELIGASSCEALGFDAPGTATDDGLVTVEGDDLGIGFSAGLLYQFTEGSRIGFHYRGDIEQRLEGDVTFNFPDYTAAVLPLADPNLRARTVGGFLDLTTPEAASLSGFHQINQRWSIQGDVIWTRWSRFQSLTVAVSDGPDIPQPQLWDDTLRFALGTEIRVNDALLVRAGAARDESPIPDETLNLNFPFEDFAAFSLGATIKLSERLGMDIGLQKTLAMDVAINQGSLTSDAAVLQGNLETDIFSMAMGITYRPGK
ncbi:OmpP1/FadL family transporter [Acanthopleuribacter pedis]|uniref:Outer membrane protein transport protein n=1 Tax=Acanthopleuribacter pedis TaxID=442870 RepID=A0A8J7U417_9BACT|nr:outer membrane protein transport protein [Acanthopleuribacter pedis]MBO1317856.1 outer membrane protein transport protein [Acanthopleuribacter pedis]